MIAQGTISDPLARAGWRLDEPGGQAARLAQAESLLRRSALMLEP